MDEDGDPAQGVAVEVVRRYKFHEKTMLSPGGRVETNDLGEYRLFDLRPGLYFLRASLPGGNGRIIGKVLLDNSVLKSAGGYVPTYYPSASEVSRASAIEVKAGDEISGAEIHGRLIWEGKSVAQTVTISLEGKEELRNHETEIASDGTFSIRGLPDGSYKFRVFSECASCYLKSATADGIDILAAGLQVSSGFAPSPVELVYSTKTATVEGIVTGDDGSPVQGATVVLIWDAKGLEPEFDDCEHYRQESTDQNGYFVFASIPPGSYHAYAWQEVNRESYTDPAFLKGFDRDATAVSVSESEKKTIRLSLLASSTENH